MTDKPITVHMVGYAHLDPVWLWRWPAGLSEAINTCRAAADIMDDYPDFVFTRPDRWIYEQIQEVAPELFERIARRVAEGRWQVVGGWYVQPDCNLPTEESFQRHAAMGKAWFREELGVYVTVGYNVDSFGHHGMLPRFLADAGYDAYVFSRPAPNEKDLPGSLFRWRGIDGAEVMAWRVVGSYGSHREDLTEHIQHAIDVADPRVGHVMCFYGVCDHGGGPTRKQLDWIAKHRDAFPGAVLKLSHPRAFFDAVKPVGDALPVVDGDLQYHGIGCYSVVHEVKRHVRRAEHGLLAAEAAIERFPVEAPAGVEERLDAAWKKTLFNTFHDILPGSSTPLAYEDARDQLGGVRDTADEILKHVFFRQVRHLPPDHSQRIALFNASNEPYEGFAQHEPWRWWVAFKGRMQDDAGNEIPYQHLQQEAFTGAPPCLLAWPFSMEPGELRTVRLVAEEEPSPVETDLVVEAGSTANAAWSVKPGKGIGLAFLQGLGVCEGLLDGDKALKVVVLPDTSDTWGHGGTGFGSETAGAFSVERCVVEEAGPIRTALRIEARFEASRLAMWVRLYRHSPVVDVDVRIFWAQKFQVAKLVFPLGFSCTGRQDGIPGGGIARCQNGDEHPLVDWTCLTTEDGRTLGFAAPDSYGIDGGPDAVRFTLLRSPPFAWHDPSELKEEWLYKHTDQGEHTFRFRLVAPATPVQLRRLALQEHRPLLSLDWTYGMPPMG
jgi:alpha-mannosidase